MENQNSPLKIPNIRLFILFKATFNTRFYYPVFAILFLDFGLTLEQFAMLNVAWAASIVVFEVPSGALADVLGRKSLLVFAGILMVIEMSLLFFAPIGASWLLFMIFTCNRILSGAAEAAASGADEAIAYDTLKKVGWEDRWPDVLERQMRVRAVAGIVAMSLGAASYDPTLMQRIVDMVGWDMHLTQDITLRFPLFLTLVMAIWTLAITLRFRERDSIVDESCLKEEGCIGSVMDAFKMTMKAGRWIFITPFALIIIILGLHFDTSMRMVITLASQYYRIIQLPEASFGIIASGISVLGFFVPKFARWLVKDHKPGFNLTIMSIIMFIGLTGMVFVIPYFGIVPLIFVVSVAFVNDFLVSHYLNRITSSEQRATVLSFKGLSFNLAYGITGLLYSFLMAFLREQEMGRDMTLSGERLENLIFAKSLYYFPPYFIVVLAALLIFSWLRLRETDDLVY